MILERFYTNKFDSEVVLKIGDKNISYAELKQYVYAQKMEFEKERANGLVLFGDNSFEFVINFFAALFSKKEIYLLTDKNRLSMLNVDYFLPKEPTKQENPIFETIEIEKTRINFFTSGSTSIPKVITKNFLNLLTEAKAISNQFAFEKDITFYSTTIMSHMFGLTFHFMLPLYLGSVISTEKVEFPEQMENVEDYILISSPSFLEKMYKYEILFPTSPKRIITAGDKLKENVCEFFKQKSDIIEIYGSTETGVIAFKNNTQNFKKFDMVGISQDKNNCIVVKSKFFMEDEVKMEDVIEKISEEEFVLKGINDRLVKIKEKRISLVELESNIKEHSSVNDCYCFKYGEVLACIVSTSDYELNDKILKEHLLKYSEIVPKKWRFLDEIPKTDTGKIDKQTIEQIFSMNLSFPFIVSRKVEENRVELELIFRKNSNFFQGHFSVMPILPGVVQLFYANYFAKKLFKIEIPCDEAKRVKFTNIIKADDKVTLVLNKKEKGIEYSYVANDKSYSSGIFVI